MNKPERLHANGLMSFATVPAVLHPSISSKVRRFGFSGGFFVVLIATFVCACEVNQKTAVSEDSPSHVRDSLGVRIVENSAPQLPPERAWTVGRTPILRLGAHDGPADGQFQFVAYVLRMGDRRILVADGARLIVFDTLGQRVRTFGGVGEGPAEFQGLGPIAAGHGDTIFVSDLGRERVTFDSAGRFVNVKSLMDLITDQHGISGFLADGSIITNRTEVGMARGEPLSADQSGRRRDGVDTSTMSFSLVDPSITRVLPLVTLPPSTRPRSGRPIFSGTEIVAIGQSEACFAKHVVFDIKCFDGQGRMRIIRRRLTKIPVDDALKEKYRKAVLGTLLADQPDRRAREQQYLDNARYADQLPELAAVLLDRLGFLWARRYDVSVELARYKDATSPLPLLDQSWEVFDSTGVFITAVSLPPRIDPSEIGEDYILGRQTIDEITEVVLLPLTRR